jgi:hypothetical protein
MQFTKKTYSPKAYRSSMGKLYLALSIATGAVVIVNSTSVKAAPTTNQYPERSAPRFAIGPSVSVVIGSQSEFFYGADAKIGLSDNFSVRPFAAFSSESSRSLYGASLSYNFPIAKSQETKVPERSYSDSLGGTITERATTYGGGEFVPFVGAGGFIDNRNTGNSSVKPYTVVGIDTPLAGLQAQYLFDESAFLLKGGLSFNF